MTIRTTPRNVAVDGLDIFYREAGDPARPTILLLHGFPTSSHMFRDLIPELAGDYHVVAPDLPGFGFSAAPDRAGSACSFDALAAAVARFVDVIGLDRFAIYVFDYGAPVGFRLLRAMPDRISAVISQNGNAYVEGLSDAWNPIRAYWQDPSEANRNALREMLTPETTRFQYEHGVPAGLIVSPESYWLDSALLARPGNADIQLDLFLDYRGNVEAYPSFQQALRDRRPPLLAVWGRGDPFFVPAGAQAFARDVPDAEIHLFDTGHFALETHAVEIGATIREFLARKLG